MKASNTTEYSIVVDRLRKMCRSWRVVDPRTPLFHSLSDLRTTPKFSHIDRAVERSKATSSREIRLFVPFKMLKALLERLFRSCRILSWLNNGGRVQVELTAQGSQLSFEVGVAEKHDRLKASSRQR
jgi:hypothetical protein